MKTRRSPSGMALVGACLIAGACSKAPEPSAAAASSAAPAPRGAESSREPIAPLRAPERPDERLVQLGARLFQERALSGDGTIACSSCHDLANGGDDGRSHSLGVGGALSAVNAPTVLNAALNAAQFWDGRAASLEAQVDGPVLNPAEMASRWEDVERKLAADPSYVEAFARAFGGPPSRDGVRRAIAAFERTLITTGAPFDRWLQGDTSALTAQQQAGYELFKSAGCIACHQGQNAGGNMFQRFGLFGDYFAARGNVTPADYGRFNVTGYPDDRFVFRVPSLRNVALTAPHFHDGSAATLTRAVEVMATYQLGKVLTSEQIGQLVAFLETLSGPLPPSSVALQAGG